MNEKLICFDKIIFRIFKLGGIYYQTVGSPEQGIENLVGDLHNIPPPKEGCQIRNQKGQRHARKFSGEIALSLQGHALAAKPLPAGALVGLKDRGQRHFDVAIRFGSGSNHHQHATGMDASELAQHLMYFVQ